MDASRFDALLRTLITARSRRRTLGGLGVGLLGLLGSRTDEAAAKKKHHKKACPPCKARKKGKCKGLLPDGTACAGGSCQGGVCLPTPLPPPPPPPPPGCVPNCVQKICGSDGCGGSCGTCDTDQVCANGRCASQCPSGQKLCAGVCIPNNQCCTDADCPAASPTCCGGGCVNVQSDVRNCGTCGVHCMLNEQCLDGACLCATGPAPYPCAAPNTCCTSGECECLNSVILDMRTCNGIQTVGCPTGTTECTATTNNCAGAPAKVCCPAGTTCTVEGTCLIA